MFLVVLGAPSPRPAHAVLTHLLVTTTLGYAPRLIYFNDGHTSDDEGADEDERDPEEDAELICRPRTTGNP